MIKFYLNCAFVPVNHPFNLLYIYLCCKYSRFTVPKMIELKGIIIKLQFIMLDNFALLSHVNKK